MSEQNLSQFIRNRAQRFGSRLAVCQHGGDPNERYSYGQLEHESARLAGAMPALGVAPGACVAILCDPRPRWGMAFFAAVRAGAFVVPLDTRQSITELCAAVCDAQPVLLIVSASHEETARRLAGGRDQMLVVSIEPETAVPGFPSIDTLAVPRDVPGIERCADDPAVVTYTSGTMGTSKGVVTTHGNLLYQVCALQRLMHNDADCTAVSVLPLSHLFELTAGFLGVLHGGGRVCYCNSLLPHEILTAMRDQHVTCMVTVPLFLRLLADSICRQMAAQAPVRRILISGCLLVSKFLPAALRRRLFRPLHRAFGGRMDYFVCGGAPLDLPTLRFFERIGLPVYQGYGLAEASPVIAANGPGANREGSVGRPMAGIEVRIAANGEILTRGPHVMSGYLHDDELTASMVDADGWLHTGDVGFVDEDGYLHVTGREKNVIVLGSGMKVQPEELEAVLFEHPDIQEGCIVGAIGRDGLTKDAEEICAVAIASDRAIVRCTEHSEDLHAWISEIVNQRARRLAPGKRPTRVILASNPLPRTSTRKIRRAEIRDWIERERISP